jgi:hypothetical protein
VSPASPANLTCRRALVLVVAALVALASFLPLQVAAAGSAHAALASGASTAHPYSDPVWWPFHDTARSSYDVRMDCAARTPGCQSSHQHTDQAVTLQTIRKGTQGGQGNYVHAPVFAAGAGIVVSVTNSTAHNCPASGTGVGNQVTIDHGAGVVSRYLHLSTIMVKKGDYVTPNTELGTTGSSGAKNSCFVDYVNFRISHNGTPVKLGRFRNCVSGSVQTLPRNYDTINDVPHARLLDRGGKSCQPSTPRTLSRPTITPMSRAGSGRLTAHWGAPTSRPGSIQAYLEVFHTTTRKWGEQARQNIDVGSSVPTSFTFIGLHDGTSYRVQVSFHNRAGWSRASAFTTKVPGAAPSTPGFRGVRSWTQSVQLLWRRPAVHGYPPTGYEVGLRRKSGASFTGWSTHVVSGTTYSYHPAGLRQHTTYQIRVRAKSAAGYSGYLTKSVTTK